jgi:hypothetical protein
MSASVTIELPPARTEPLADAPRAMAPLSRRQRATARELLAGEDVFLVLRSRTRVDVGSWLGGSRLCIAVLADALLLFATPRNPLAWLPARWRVPERLGIRAEPFAERIALAELSASTYNHVTGELLLSGGRGGRAWRLKLPALDAYQLLAQIQHGLGGAGSASPAGPSNGSATGTCPC